MKLDPIENSIGQKLLHVIKHDCNRSILFIFDGDVKCQLRATHGYSVDDYELEESSFLYISEYSKEELLKYGVITQAWLDKQEAARKRKMKSFAKAKEAAELAEYRRLKKKFEEK